MKIEKSIKKELNKWQCVFYLGRDWTRGRAWYKNFKFGIFKLEALPKEGVTLNKGLYKGFFINFNFCFLGFIDIPFGIVLFGIVLFGILRLIL